MKAFCGKLICAIVCSIAVLPGFAQQDQSILINRMRQHEQNILMTYLEFQKLYYEDKSRINELNAFEDLLTVYINQVKEIYETLNLSEKNIQIPRDITAGALIFKALMYLEKAPLNNEFYEKACYEYYEALKIYEGTEDPPVLFKDLPHEIQSGNKVYYRLIDLLDDKGPGLLVFGKVIISFRNFSVTSNFDPQMIELIKVTDESGANNFYTYKLAESRIKNAFKEVFRKSSEVETYVALPYGTYILKLNQGDKSNYTTLTRFYVRANQEQRHVMEPLADWLILYENPTSTRPDFYKFRRTHQGIKTAELASNDGFQLNENNSMAKQKENYSNNHTTSTPEKLVSEIVAEYLNQFDVKLMIDLNEPEIKEKAVQTIAQSIVGNVESKASFNDWNIWTTSWDISKKVRDIISPESLVPIELVELIHAVLKEL
ncbi:MAG: hypothetical protein ACE5HI_00765 [bacterium]